MAVTDVFPHSKEISMKETKSSAELDQLVAHAVRGIEKVADARSTGPATDAQIGPVYWHAPDDAGRNWNISAGRNLGPFTGAVARVVDGLRDRYDMKNPAA
jgi:hypothetical protein